MNRKLSPHHASLCARERFHGGGDWPQSQLDRSDSNLTFLVATATSYPSTSPSPVLGAFCESVHFRLASA
jgi:hypothetical protein